MQLCYFNYVWVYMEEWVKHSHRKHGRNLLWSMRRENRKTSMNLRGPRVEQGGLKSVDRGVERVTGH